MAHIYDFIYDPLENGAIDHINYREDRIEIQAPFEGSAVGTTFLVTQGGTRYASAAITNGSFTSTSWETATRNGITAQQVGGANFSIGGGPIRFGYTRSNSNDSAEEIFLAHGIDNWRVEICRVAAGPALPR